MENSNGANLENLLNPKSIAIIGASEEEGKIGNVISKNILTLGYLGEVFLVNPKHDEILGRKCYKSVSEIGKEIDVAIVAIPAKFVNGLVLESADRIKNFVIISAGFSEMNEEGKTRETELKKIAEEKGLNILGPNCLGFIIPRLNLNASFAGGLPDAGNVAFISQSGALAVAMMDVAKKEGIKFSGVFSVGNKMQITEISLLEYLKNDENTKVIGMYLEGIENGQEFMRIAREVSKIKPIVVIKAGKTEKAQKAISSHTGALAGSDEITSAVFEKVGIIRAENLEEFFDLVDLISNVPFPKTEQVAIITNAGGPGVLTTDAFLGKEIKPADISEKIKTKLREFLPEESSLENPIDLLGDAMEDRYDKTLKLMAKDESIGSIICVLTPQDQTPVLKIARKIVNFRKKTEKTVITVFIGGDRIKRAVKKMEENNIPNFGFPDRAVSALNAYYNWSKFVEGGVPIASIEINSERKSKVSEIIRRAQAENRGALYFSESAQVMRMYGIKTVNYVEAGQDLAEPLDFPVVLKVDSDKVLHKTDKQGLILDIKNQDGLKEAIFKMRNSFPGEKLIVQPMLLRQTELIMGIKKDAVFGPVLVYGLGGIYTEVFRWVDFLVLPVSEEDAIRSIMKSKLGFLFQETRGQKPYDVKELAGILLGLGQLSQEISEIAEFDINPLLIYNDGKEAVAVDVKTIIHPVK